MLEESTLDYHDPEWVASRLGIDKNAVYKYLTQGMLPGLRLGRKWLISESSLLDFLKGEERHQTEGRRAMFSVETLLTDEIDVPIGLFSERARRVLGVGAGGGPSTEPRLHRRRASAPRPGTRDRRGSRQGSKEPGRPRKDAGGAGGGDGAGDGHLHRARTRSRPVKGT